MTIKDAKKQIQETISVYLEKDEFDNYVIPIEKQRPVFLMGAPGIGKTAIMEQIAGELEIALVSYSMTHHTRQSALGLPFIVQKNYGGEEFSVSEYTMSEIIASVYDIMESSGKKEGILFLDEINCVSETLAPSMLQFLQYKIFGRHKVPDGWIVVTAGNPPEYNNSVREFDIVTWDRLKRIDVEPDFDVWKEYEINKGIHLAVLTYLEIKKQNFYIVESTADGKEFVTARGWDDMSMIIKLYEKKNYTADIKLISQYIQKNKIAKDFANYYDLFVKYRSDYQIEEILKGEQSEYIIERAKNAKFDERLSVVGLLLDAVRTGVNESIETEEMLTELRGILKKLKSSISAKDSNPTEIISDEIEKLKKAVKSGKQSGSMSVDKQRVMLRTVREFETIKGKIYGNDGGTEAFDNIKACYDNSLKLFKNTNSETKSKISNAFKFMESAFGGGHEMLIFMTELTASEKFSAFISHFGCEEYYRHSNEMMLHERGIGIKAEIEELEKLNEEF